MSRATLALAIGVLAVFALSQTAVSSPAASGGRADAGTAAGAPRPGGLQRIAVSAAHRVPEGFAVARVRRMLRLSARPGGPAVTRLGPHTEFGSPRVLSVAARRGTWLGVHTAARPNGRLGWIRRDAPGLRFSRVRSSLHGDLSARRVELRRGGRVVRRLRVAIGRPGSPTPTGRFAVTDRLRGGRFGPYYGCCVLALSAHQPRPPAGWRGGNRMAIHGTSSPGTIGAAVSAGCLRAADGDLEVLMAAAPAGTPVFIHP
jgi:lipoprotein-anchoring transpeptidase ErfK/SrfK